MFEKLLVLVRSHPLITRFIPICIGVIVPLLVFSTSYADGVNVTTGFFQSTDAYWGYGLGATSGFGFGEWLNRRAWQARDKEMERLRNIEKEHNDLRNEALKEKLNG